MYYAQDNMQLDPLLEGGAVSAFDFQYSGDPSNPVKTDPGTYVEPVVVQDYNVPINQAQVDEPVITMQQQPLGDSSGTVVDIKDPAAAAENKSAALWIVGGILLFLMLSKK